MDWKGAKAVTIPRVKKWGRAVVLIGCLASGVAALHLVYGQATATTKPDQGANLLPDGAGKQLVQTKCLACHDARVIISKKGTQDDWNQTVNKMITHGANVTDDEADTIVDYLSAHFPATGAPQTNATGPEGGTQSEPVAAGSTTKN